MSKISKQYGTEFSCIALYGNAYKPTLTNKTASGA